MVIIVAAEEEDEEEEKDDGEVNYTNESENIFGSV